MCLRLLSSVGKIVIMAKIRIFKNDGTPTAYFWSSKHSSNRAFMTVFKQTPDGIKRMKGVHFNAVKNTMHKHSQA